MRAEFKGNQPPMCNKLNVLYPNLASAIRFLHHRSLEEKKMNQINTLPKFKAKLLEKALPGLAALEDAVAAVAAAVSFGGAAAEKQLHEWTVAASLCRNAVAACWTGLALCCWGPWNQLDPIWCHLRTQNTKYLLS